MSNDSKLEQDVLIHTWDFISNLNKELDDGPYRLEVRENFSIMLSILGKFKDSNRKCEYALLSIYREKNEIGKFVLTKKRNYNPASGKEVENRIAEDYNGFLQANILKIKGKITPLGF